MSDWPKVGSTVVLGEVYDDLRAELAAVKKDLAHWKDCHGVTADQLAAVRAECVALKDTAANYLDEIDRLNKVGGSDIDPECSECKRLRERCYPSKVVMIGDTGHYVSEAVFTEVERLRDELHKPKGCTYDTEGRRLTVCHELATLRKDRNLEVELLQVVRALLVEAYPYVTSTVLMRKIEAVLGEKPT